MELMQKECETVLNKNYCGQQRDAFLSNIKNKLNHPLNEEVSTLIRKKLSLWTRYKTTKNKINYQECKIIRNTVRAQTRKYAEAEHNEMATKCKTNPNKFWDQINSKVKCRNEVGEIRVKII